MDRKKKQNITISPATHIETGKSKWRLVYETVDGKFLTRLELIIDSMWQKMS